MRTVQPHRRSSSLPLVLVGRVAHREQSERCDGWGCFRKQVFSHLYVLPPPGASRHPRASFARLDRASGRDKKRGANATKQSTHPVAPWIASHALATTASNFVSLLPRIDSRCMVIEYNYSRRGGLYPMANSMAPWLHAMPGRRRRRADKGNAIGRADRQ